VQNNSQNGSYSPVPIELCQRATIDQTWGAEMLLAETPEYTLKLLRYRAGKAGGLQFHTRKDEAFHLYMGTALVDCDMGAGLWRTEMKPGQTFHVPAGAVHRFTAITDCVVFEASTNVKNDRVRMEAYYGEPPVEGLPSTAPEPIRPS
jgi:mannose-6-phosphate isomerase-like protein (cupin superfamily)